MYNLQRKFLFFILVCNTMIASAQFNTVLPKSKDVAPSVITKENISTSIEAKKENIDSMIPESPQMKLIKLRKYLALPVDTVVPTSNYGWRDDPITGKRKFHRGIDIAADYNYIYSVMPGKVIKSGKDKGLGNFVEIKSGDFRIIYGHLYQNLVNIKQSVEAGTPIGISGSSGRSTGEHLHFQIIFKNETIDPKPILNFIQSVSDFTKNELSQMIEEEIKKTKNK